MSNTPHDTLFKATFSEVEHAAGELRQLATTTIGEDVEEAIVTLADRLREEERIKGEQRGRAEGEKHGALEAQRRVLLPLLMLRFGKLPEAATSRIEVADADQLEIWTERVLAAPTLAAVLDVS